MFWIGDDGRWRTSVAATTYNRRWCGATSRFGGRTRGTRRFTTRRWFRRRSWSTTHISRWHWWWTSCSRSHCIFRWWTRRTTSHRRRQRRPAPIIRLLWRRRPATHWWHWRSFTTHTWSGTTQNTTAADSRRSATTRTISIVTIKFTFTVRATFTLNVHFLVAGVSPTIRILFLGFQQLLVPIFVGAGTRLFHYVVDFFTLSNCQTGIFLMI